MTRDLLLAIGVLLTIASQLRFNSAPMGPGELCLVIWIALTLGREALRREPRFISAFSWLVIFWLIFGLAQCIGTFTGYAIADVHDSVLFIHDAMAYPLLAAISILSAAGPDAGFRMRGWSGNPNQLAFLCAVLTLLSLHLADVATSAPARIVAIASGILSVYVGRLEAGMLGLGSGPHLPIPATILAGREDTSNEPKYLEHPTNNGTPNFEAHGTPLDLFTQGGLLAVLAFFWLTAIAALQTWEARLDGLTTLLGGLAIFITFHLIVRQPIFWLAISICLVAAEDRKLRLTRAWSR